MGTVVIGAGPHPTAQVYSVTPISDDGVLGTSSYEIREGAEVLARFAKLSHAQALLPLIRSGE